MSDPKQIVKTDKLTARLYPDDESSTKLMRDPVKNGYLTTEPVELRSFAI